MTTTPGNTSRGATHSDTNILLACGNLRTTEVVYRRELRPVIATGAEVMDKIFSA